MDTVEPVKIPAPALVRNTTRSQATYGEWIGHRCVDLVCWVLDDQDGRPVRMWSAGLLIFGLCVACVWGFLWLGHLMFGCGG